ncbi:MAG: sulfatase [Deltaproteobacteria bacterium]|nr:sulfatase [Deltaproteobacteria bacterium]
MKDALKTGALAGLAAGILLGVVEIIVALEDAGINEAPLYGYLLMPFFLWGLLLPLSALIGAALNLWFWCWHSNNTLSLRATAMKRFQDFKAGALESLGWLWAVWILVAGMCFAGGYLHVRFSEAFHNKWLAGILLALSLLVLCLFSGVVLRRLLVGLGHAISRLGPRRPMGLPLSVHLAILSGVFIIGGFIVALFLAWNTIQDIGIDILLWMASVPAVYLAAFVLVVAVAPIWRRWRRLTIWMVVSLFGCLVMALGLGDLQAVRQASMSEDTPSSVVTSLLRTATDFDDDGFSGFLGGGDCAPFDKRIHPGAMEIPDNGLDDNCVAGDASIKSKGLRNKKAFAPLPNGFPGKPNLVLITVDALRADHMSLFNYKRRTTPGIDRHARNGVVFERAYSQGTGTISSMPSLLTSKYSYQLLYTDDNMPPAISPRETMLAEHLKKAGYVTLSVTPIAYATSGRWGLLQGIDFADQSPSRGSPNSGVTSPQVLDIAKKLLDKGKKSGKPYFLWVHFYDPHSKYVDHAGQKPFGKSAMDKYDGEILFTDKYVSQLLDVLRAPNEPPTVIIFGADHGDGFRNDRGKRNHAYGLYNELLHVPLIVWAPNAKPRRVDTPVGNIDITATFVNAAGLKKPYLRGNSLIPYLYNGYRDPDRLIFSEKTFGRGRNKRYQKSVTGMNWKMVRWITERREFLFNLAEDPKETNNVLSQHAEIANELRSQIDSFMERNAIDTLKLE